MSKMPKITHPHFAAPVLAALTAICAPHSEAASLAVDWGGNYVSADQSLTTGGFSGGNPLSLSPAASYSGTSAQFYGKVEIFSGSPSLLDVIQNNAGADRIQLKSSDITNNTGFLVLWKQADFLNGLNTGNVGFDNTSSVTLNITTYAAQTADSGRLVLRLGSSYYISDRIYSSAANTTTPDLTALSYYAYDPVNAMNVDSPTGPVSILTGGMIQNVTEVGFYFESVNASNAVRIQDFEVNLIAVPEPGIAALLCAAVPLMGRRRRKTPTRLQPGGV